MVERPTPDIETVIPLVNGGMYEVDYGKLFSRIFDAMIVVMLVQFVSITGSRDWWRGDLIAVSC